jgi:hypothetical protein
MLTGREADALNGAASDRGCERQLCRLMSDYERKDAFEGSVVIGYYKGKAIFIEPMISKAVGFTPAT